MTPNTLLLVISLLPFHSHPPLSHEDEDTEARVRSELGDV